MNRSLSRKEFVQMTLAAMGAGALAACSSSSTAAPAVTPDSGGGGNCKTNGAQDGGIDDPKHHLVVPAADVLAGVDKSYSIQGTQTHDHMVTVTAAMFMQLAANMEVPMIVSTVTLNHSHTFAVICA
jgi:hypothetical protein